MPTIIPSTPPSNMHSVILNPSMHPTSVPSVPPSGIPSSTPTVMPSIMVFLEPNTTDPESQPPTVLPSPATTTTFDTSTSDVYSSTLNDNPTNIPSSQPIPTSDFKTSLFTSTVSVDTNTNTNINTNTIENGSNNSDSGGGLDWWMVTTMILLAALILIIIILFVRHSQQNKIEDGINSSSTIEKKKKKKKQNQTQFGREKAVADALAMSTNTQLTRVTSKSNSSKQDDFNFSDSDGMNGEIDIDIDLDIQLNEKRKLTPEKEKNDSVGVVPKSKVSNDQSVHVKKEMKWKCTHCTLLNQLNDTRCPACGGVREKHAEVVQEGIGNIKQEFEDLHANSSGSIDINKDVLNVLINDNDNIAVTFSDGDNNMDDHKDGVLADTSNDDNNNANVNIGAGIQFELNIPPQPKVRDVNTIPTSKMVNDKDKNKDNVNPINGVNIEVTNNINDTAGGHSDSETLTNSLLVVGGGKITENFTTTKGWKSGGELKIYQNEHSHSSRNVLTLTAGDDNTNNDNNKNNNKNNNNDNSNYNYGYGNKQLERPSVQKIIHGEIEGLMIQNTAGRANSVASSLLSNRQVEQKESDKNKNNEMQNVQQEVRDEKDNANSDADDVDMNWQTWDKEEVKQWIKNVLIENNFEENEVISFINDTFDKLNITGKILEKLKTNQHFWKQFEKQIENQSFGISIAVTSAINNLN